MLRNRSRSFLRNLTLEGPHERHQVLLFLGGQLEPQHQVEELDRVLEGQQAAVVQVGRRVLDAAQREGLDRAVRRPCGR